RLVPRSARGGYADLAATRKSHAVHAQPIAIMRRTSSARRDRDKRAGTQADGVRRSALTSVSNWQLIAG
ncbi:MAG TPA: hypothetical protein VJX23_14940, partial [Candidatus Binataceae bacterium]|nr:hypothetical protein [Candidatus Binataceae bacterium]